MGMGSWITSKVLFLILSIAYPSAPHGTPVVLDGRHTVLPDQ